MSTLLHRLLGRTTRSSSKDYAVVELQLRLLVAMAAADDRVSDVEHEQILDFIDRNTASERAEKRLLRLLDHLLAAPPDVDELLDELAEYGRHANLGERLASELADVAYSDEVVDHREEFLLDLVCEVFDMDSHPLQGSDEALDVDDLRHFVHRLAVGDWRAA